MRQLEQALSTSGDGGTSRMDIQLNPAEQGSIGLVLTSRDGVVSALIRPEQADTAEMIERQVDALRISLEQQGVRVDRIEVQPRQGSGDDHPQDTRSFGEASGGQEENSRQHRQERLRETPAPRSSAAAEEPSEVERSMQVLDHAARYAARTLHLVA
jgi:flagellar hook-length control protein FliK